MIEAQCIIIIIQVCPCLSEVVYIHFFPQSQYVHNIFFQSCSGFLLKLCSYWDFADVWKEVYSVQIINDRIFITNDHNVNFWNFCPEWMLMTWNSRIMYLIALWDSGTNLGKLYCKHRKIFISSWQGGSVQNLVFNPVALYEWDRHKLAS